MERAKLAELRKIHYHKAGASEGWDEEVCKPKIRIFLCIMSKILFGKAKIGFALIVCLLCKSLWCYHVIMFLLTVAYTCACVCYVLASIRVYYLLYDYVTQSSQFGLNVHNDVRHV